MLPAMSRLAHAVGPTLPYSTIAVLGLVGLLALASGGCEDQDKKKAELIAKTGGSASGAPLSSAAAAASAATAKALASAMAAATASAKPAKECGPDLKIDDPALEAEIRNKLKKPKDANPAPLTDKDLAGLTSLKVPAKAVPLAELDPCVFPKLVGLKFLYLPRGTYKDVTPLAGLTKLEGLFLNDSEVEDLKPLEKLAALDQLGLTRTKVTDISPVANMVSLTELTLDDTKVSDLGPLAKCSKLMSLSIKNTAVTDVSPLKGLTKLTKLNVTGTALTNVDTLDPLKAKGLKIITK